MPTWNSHGERVATPDELASLTPAARRALQCPCNRGHVRCSDVHGGTCYQPDKRRPRGRRFGTGADPRRNTVPPNSSSSSSNSSGSSHPPTHSATGATTVSQTSLLSSLTGPASPRPLSPELATTLGRSCPACGVGTLTKKVSRHGEFVGCSRYPKCTHVVRKGAVTPTENQDATPPGTAPDAGSVAPSTPAGTPAGTPGTATLNQAAGTSQGPSQGQGQQGASGEHESGESDEREGDEGERESEPPPPQCPTCGADWAAPGVCAHETPALGAFMERRVLHLAAAAALPVATRAVAALKRDVDGTLGALTDALNDEITSRVNAALAAAVQAGTLGGTVVHQTAVTVTGPTGTTPTTHVVDGLQHEVFAWVLRLAGLRMHTLLVGPAGCGKSHMAKGVAKALGLSFGTVSCSGGLSEAGLTGRLVPGDGGAFEFRSTEFIRCYEEGGLFLLDEIDAADANVLLVLNQALANGLLPLPNRTANPYALQHPDFVLLAAANTFGRGADRQYVGRTQLDAATLDRFACAEVLMHYDRRLEAQIIDNQTVLARFWALRDKVEALGVRRIVSTRGMQAAAKLANDGVAIDEIVQHFTQSWTQDEKTKCGVA